MTRLARMERMPMTTSNSINVNAGFFVLDRYAAFFNKMGRRVRISKFEDFTCWIFTSTVSDFSWVDMLPWFFQTIRRTVFFRRDKLGA